ncbi:hypothetical protein [Faecalibacter bovis]|uniref:Uncharacterized protein n=1 Tax=Faecalibacter bovis TaxID=2898187 RepID=A0ABX7XG74_9FLAO|nr:hypothetical protein [Faecalibacter bovis]MBS7333075.1 hypothetical protein [Weeksellaceae bacterium]QTV06875.1 hypothetical protein J9309_06070 [Faecalibacter bovis]
MLLNQKIIIKSFLGLQNSSEDDLNDNENYWRLIGETGTIIEESNEYFTNRVLIMFDKNLDDLKLINHNPIKNTLWILIKDLEIII